MTGVKVGTRLDRAVTLDPFLEYDQLGNWTLSRLHDESGIDLTLATAHALNHLSANGVDYTAKFELDCANGEATGTLFSFRPDAQHLDTKIFDAKLFSPVNVSLRVNSGQGKLLNLVVLQQGNAIGELTTSEVVPLINSSLSKQIGVEFRLSSGESKVVDFPIEGVDRALQQCVTARTAPTSKSLPSQFGASWHPLLEHNLEFVVATSVDTVELPSLRNDVEIGREPVRPQLRAWCDQGVTRAAVLFDNADTHTPVAPSFIIRLSDDAGACSRGAKNAATHHYYPSPGVATRGTIPAGHHQFG